MEQQQPVEVEVDDTSAISNWERVFYSITSFVCFVFSGLFAPSLEEIRALPFREQYHDWEMAAVIFATAVLIGYHAVAPPYKRKK